MTVIHSTLRATTDLDDGTYRLLPDLSLVPEIRETGYWVALREITDPTAIADGEYVGVWLEPHTDRVWMDASVWLDSRESAIALGIKHRQLAIWDCAKRETIDL